MTRPPFEDFSTGGALHGSIWSSLAARLDPEAAGLQPGTQLGPYRIRALLGEGGMGRVYRAHDPTLGREVAIKALANAGASHELTPGQVLDLRRRFEREARILAALNHPNIAAIFGFELIDQVPYLILELVEGPTLAERLQRGPLSIAEATSIAVELALALQQAHRRGVVHRDLKPANIKLGPANEVKVLDFGIAKPVARPMEEHPPAELEPSDGIGAGTGAGVILGTAAYMSPEQIRGEPADTRTDIWAFGCVLYELLTGRPVFRAGSRGETLASVLRDPIDWSPLPAATPPALRRLLRRCLQRELSQRLQDIGDARLELTDLLAGRDEAATTLDASPPLRSRWRGPGLGALSAALSAIAAAALVVLLGPRANAPAPSAPPSRLSLDLPADLTISHDFATPFAVSPDGQQVVVLAAQHGQQQLFRRALASLQVTPIAGTVGAWQPFISPDGRSVAFFADRKLMTASLSGGPALPLAEIGGNPRGGCWTRDGSLILAASPRSGLVRVPAGGGNPNPLTRLDRARGESSHRWPQALPGDRWILFTASVGDATFDEARLEVVSLSTGERRVLVEEASFGRFARGQLFFARAGRMFAVALDPRTLALGGSTELVLDGVRYDPRSGSADFAVSDDGQIIYSPAAPTSPEQHLAWIDGQGRLARIGDSPRRYSEPQLSPDGRRVVVRIRGAGTPQTWVVETDSATLSRVPAALPLHRAVWTADSRSLTAGVQEGGRWKLITLPASGPGRSVTLFESPNRVYPNAWSRDGRLLVFQELRPDTTWDLRLLQFDPDGRPRGPPRDLAAAAIEERNASLSADGRWLAYEADEPDGVIRVYVAPLDSPGDKIRITATRARWPRWGAGGELYYWYPVGRPAQHGERNDHRLHQFPDGLQRQVRATPGDHPPAAPLPVWARSPELDRQLARLVVAPHASFAVDLSRPAPRFLVLQSSGPDQPPVSPRPVVLSNWTPSSR